MTPDDLWLEYMWHSRGPLAKPDRNLIVELAANIPDLCLEVVSSINKSDAYRHMLQWFILSCAGRSKADQLIRWQAYNQFYCDNQEIAF
jgi:hypothetical protein